MNSILIESNRVIADSQINTNKSLTQTSAEHSYADNNASWRTTIDSGIQVNVGDQISLEACALNLNGAGSGDFQQFNGKVDVPDADGTFRTDNQVNLTIAYYTTNNIEFNFPLPSGKHMVDVNPSLQSNYGSPSLDGRMLWRPNYKKYDPANFHTEDVPVPSDAMKFVLEKNGPLNGPTSQRQAFGGYFWVGMNYSTYPIPLGTGTSQPEPDYCQSVAESQAYVNWTSTTNFQNPTGVQFGQAKGPILPLATAPGYDSATPQATTVSTLNMNVGVKNRPGFTNSGYFPSGKNGAANPLLLLGGVAEVKPQINCNGGLSNKAGTCSDLNEWDNLGPNKYTYGLYQEPGVYKGSVYNNIPNQRKLYQPKKDVKENYCRGPFYDVEMNDLRPTGTTAAMGDPSMNGMLNFRDPTKQKRMPSYWDFQTEEIKIKLKTGNIAPTRIGEIITETFKARHGNADYPLEKFFPQVIYKPRSAANRPDKPGEMNEETVGGISSLSYSTFPTLQGSCLHAAKTVTNVNGNINLGNVYGWDMLTDDDLNPDYKTTTNSGASPGRFFNVSQAKMQYWSNQLCGNPYEWRCVTELVPLIQYRPFGDWDLLPPATGFDYRYWSVYTGEHKIAPEANSFTTFNKRIAADGSAVLFDIGEYGDLPCLLEAPAYRLSDRASIPYQGLWWLTEGTASALGGGGSPSVGPFRLNSRPVGQWYGEIGQLNPNLYARKYRVLDTKKKEILLTNIVYDGQCPNVLFNENADKIKGHEIQPGVDDSLSSQSTQFFDGTFVEWKIGRLNDQMTFPEQPILGVEQWKLYQYDSNLKGVAQYLPNTYQTNYHFKWIPTSGGDITSPREDITDILTWASLTGAPSASATNGGYNMCPMRMGNWNSGGTFTSDTCPEQYFRQAQATTAYENFMYGPPCYTFFKDEYEYDIEEKTGFQKVADRTIKGYRYLPQTGDASGVPYTAYNAYYEKIHTGLDPKKWSTSPGLMSFEDFEVIWNKAASLNDGRGCGWIPIFSADDSKPTEFKNIPFLGIIYQDREQDQLPAPAKGEFIMMGSTPSLSQNDLHLPHSTQQTHEDQWKSGNVGMCPSATNGPPTAEEVTEMQENGLPSNWATSKYVGTNDPIWNFDNVYNRYTYAKFHTDYFKGNGQFSYGNTGASSNPDAREVQILGKTAACSQQLTLPNGAIGELTGSDPVRMKYAETIFGNIVWDGTNPGGRANNVGSIAQDNEQYGSPISCTQWELKYNPKPGGQSSTGFPTGEAGPPQEGKNDDDLIMPSSLVPYAYIEAEKVPYPTISAQAGIGIVGVAVPREKGSVVVLSNSDYFQFKGTLLDKMGFSLNQYLPLFGKVQTQLNHTLFNKYTGPDAPAGYAYHNLCAPVTTQAQISTSITPALQNGFGVTPENVPITAPVDTPMPFYRLGMLIPSGATIGTSESMFAERLPQKLTFPYLVCRSNIQTPTGLQYCGGANGQQLLPVISYLMTNYATNDFFYINRSDLVFTCTRPYVITEVRTSIHLPNGELADSILDENSAVIYRIDFAQDNLTPKQENERQEAIDELLGYGKVVDGGEKKEKK